MKYILPLELPCSSHCKESACIAGDLGSIPGLARSSGEGKEYPLQDSGLENSMGIAELDRTERLSLSFSFHYQAAILALKKLWLRLCLWNRT